MHKHIRFFAPAALAVLLGLAGCQTPPRDGDEGAAGSPGQAQGAPAAPQPGTGAQQSAMPVEFFIAQLEPSDDLVKIDVSDGSIYVQQLPVLTRADLAEAAAMVDKQGQHFVGLRFNEPGARKLADVSTKNVGKLMVLAVNRQMAAAPRIAEPLDRGVLAFRVGSAEEARELAAAIRGEPRPGGAAAPAGSPASQPAPAPAAN